MEKTGSLSARMKGGGGIGITGGGRGEEDTHQSASRPYPPGIHPGGDPVLLMFVLLVDTCLTVSFLSITFLDTKQISK